MPPQNLLVVDDDKLICWALQREFVALNIVARAVDNAADARTELRNNPYDLVFLDIHLPDGNGLDLIEEIGRISPESRIVVMSGDATDYNRKRALAAGAIQFLEKPFDLYEIRSVLRSVSRGFPKRRKHPRYVCRIPVRLSVVEPSPEEAQFDLRNLMATMANVGVGGLQIHTEYPLRVGQSIRTSLAREDDSFSRFVFPDTPAEVVWVAPAADGIAAGVRFLS